MAKRQDLAVVLRFNAETGQLEGQVRNVERLLKQAADAGETAGRKMGDGFTRAERDARGLSARLDSMRNLAAGLFASLATGVTLNKIVETKRQFDVLNASLETVTGSADAAQQAFSWIQQFANQTPYQLAEVTQAFVKMKALGLDASIEALRSYGNTAAAMGKSLDQFIEAVADAATGEFERLKEFGIKARQEGEKVTLTFRGVSTTIGNNAEEIVAYLQKIGNTDFAGAMERRMATLDGAISNLADSWENLFITIGNSSVGNLIADSVRLATATINDLNTILKALNTTTAQTTGEMGALKVIQEGLAIAFETVAVVGANVKYVIEQIGRDLGGLAAAAAAALSGDFSRAGEIFRMMGEDADKARKEIDALSERILNARKVAQENAKASVKQASGTEAVASAAQKAAATTQEYGKALSALLDKINSKDAGVDSDFYKNLELLRDAYESGKLGLDEYRQAAERYIKQQSFYIKAVKRAEEATKKRRDEEEKARQEREKAVQSAEALVEQIEFETKALQMSNAEREIAIKLRELERKGIKAGTAEYEEYARRIRDAIVGKEAIEASIEQQRRAREEWQRVWDDVSRGFVDALMEGGKSVKEYLVKLFRTMVLRPILQPIVGGVVGSLGLGSMSSAFAAEPGSLGAALGLSNTVSAIKGIYNTVIGGFTSLGNSVAFAAQDIGAWLVQNTTGILNSAGASIMQAAGTLGTAASYLGGIGAGIGIGNLISGGYSAIGNANISNIGGTAIGAVFGGPLGAAIGGAVGGLVNRAFGRKLKDQGIEGTFGGDGFTGNSYQFYKGGLFRSNKTKRGPIDPKLDQALDQQFMAIKAAAVSMAQALGLGTDAIDNFTTDIKVSFKGLNEQQIQEKLNETLGGVGDKMAASLLEGTDAVIRAGETAGEALQRLGGSLLVVNDAFDALGLAALDASVSSGEAASQIVDAFGGLDAFAQATSAYYEAMYSETEKIGEAMSDLDEKFQALGVSVPESVDAFRDLVAVQDLTTASGREMFSQLVQLGPAFAGLMSQMQQSIGLTADALRGVFQKVLSEAKSAEEARLMGEQAAGQMLMDAIGNALVNTVTDLVSNAILQPITQSIVGAAAQAATIDVAAASAAGANMAAGAAAAGANMAAGGAAAGSNMAAGGAAAGSNMAAGGAAAGQGLAEIVGKAISVTNAMVEILNNADFQQAFGNAVSAIGSISAGLYTGMSSISFSLGFSGGGGGARAGGGGGGGGGGREDDSAKRLADLLAEKRQLEIRLLEAQGKKQEALNKIREDAIDGLTAEAVAVYDANRALEAQIQALQERSSLEERLLRLQGDTAALRARELASVDASNRAILERIYALEDEQAAYEAAKRATDAAFDAVQRAIRAAAQEAENALTSTYEALRKSLETQIKSAQAARDVADESLDSLRGIFDLLRDQIADLRGEAGAGMTSAQGLAFIDQSIATARATGYMPDRDALSEAIAAARSGLRAKNYATSFELQRDRLMLAGKLGDLQTLAGEQMTVAERHLAVAEEQLELLESQLEQARDQYEADMEAIRSYYDQMLQDAQTQIDVLRGIDRSVLEVSAAIDGLASAIRSEMDARAANGLLIRTRARGGYTPPGLTLVGEEGPELVNFKYPGMVYTADQTASILSGGSSGVASELRQLREENRAQARAIVQLQSRIARLLERWDADGLPEERVVTA